MSPADTDRSDLQPRHPRMNSPAGAARFSQRRRLSIVLTLNLALIGGLVIVGVTANSVGVLAAAGDTVADSIALVLGLVAVALRDRDPDHPRANRPIAIVALINAAILIAVTISVAIEAFARLAEGSPAVLGFPMAVVSLITLAVMVAGALVLGLSAHREDIHMKSVLLDTLADAAAAAGVLVAGVVIWLTAGLYWLDPVIALVLAAVIGYAGARLAAQAIAALRGADIDFDND
ncbi:cation diffusion facilitator family transporter [Microbacterium sp. STN6]|uniref:cation diffusion facilitator family transporter n=1 Tax=Microbacterium sp. STN6 TaxID=2995588 RepID=UPI0022608EDE|nr:cation diffusion facilitator family transporter [Microbacterium sp. STN6]MCX7522726.1 cation diffusion facilitator family transporter [Microbacterium sp. STN6]